MYSDMSKRTSARSLPNRNAARERATSVLPTPVGPRNRKLPTGRFGFLSPARVRRMARDRALMALSCDTIRLCSSSSMRSSFCDSSSLTAVMGMPVHFETTSSMSPFVTSWLPGPPISQCSRTMVQVLALGQLLVAEEARAALPVAAVHHHPDAALELRLLLGGLGVAQLHPAARLVEQVDGLVGQEAVGDVAARLVDRGLQGLVAVGHVVELLVPVLDAAQDLDRLLLGGRRHLHRLEAPLQRAVLLDVLAVFGGGGGADALDLAAREGRLQDVGGVQASPRPSPPPPGCGARR